MKYYLLLPSLNGSLLITILKDIPSEIEGFVVYASSYEEAFTLFTNFIQGYISAVRVLQKDGKLSTPVIADFNLD